MVRLRDKHIIKETFVSLPLKNQLFLSFSTIFLIIVLIFWFFSVIYLNDQIKKSEREKFRVVVENIENHISNAVKQAWIYCDNSMLNAYTRNLVSTDHSIGHLELVNYQNQLYSGVNFHPYISDAFVLATKRDIVVSSFSIIESSDNFFRYNISLSHSSRSVRELLKETIYRKVILDQVSWANNNEPSLLLLQKDIYSSHDSSLYAGLVISLKALLKHYDEYSDISLCLQESNIEIWLGSTPPKEASQLYVLQDNKMKTNETVLINGVYMTSIDLFEGISIGITQSRSALSSSVYFVQDIFNIVLMLILIVGIGSAFLLSRLFGKSIGKLLTLFGNSSKASGMCEFVTIRSEVNKLLEREKEVIRQLSIVIPKYKKYLLQSMLSKTVNGNTEREIAQLARFSPMKHFEAMIVTEKNINSVTFSSERLYRNGVCVLLLSKYVDSKIPEGTIVMKMTDLRDIHPCFLFGCICLAHQNRIEFAQLPRKSEFFLDEKIMDLWLSSLKSLLCNQVEQVALKCAMLCNNHTSYFRAQTAYLYYYAQHFGYINHSFDTNFMQQLSRTSCLEENAKLFIQSTLRIINLMKEQQSNETKNAHRNEIARLVQLHYLDSDFSLDRLADEMFLHKTYLSSLINSLFGVSFTDLVNSRRVEYSITLMRNSTITVEQLAKMSGFLSSTTYRRAFRKKYNVTPMEYIKKLACNVEQSYFAEDQINRR